MPTILDCPSCGRKLRVADGPVDASFQCPSCGTTFAPPPSNDAPPQEPVAYRCPYCREDIAATDVRCRHCGEELHSDRPPWEQAGTVRRDAEPHRGSLILLLGIVGLVSSVLMCGLIGAPVSLTALLMGRRDLRLMREGIMDPQGKETTMPGMICGIIGTVYGVLVLLAFGLMLLPMFYLMF